MQKDNKIIFISLLVATVLSIISGLVTRFENQPINGIIMSWNKANVPSHWTELRNKGGHDI